MSQDLSEIVVAAVESLGWNYDYRTRPEIEPCLDDAAAWLPDVEISEVQKEGHWGAVVGIWAKRRIVVGVPNIVWLGHSPRRERVEVMGKLVANDVTVDRLVPILRRAHRTRRRRLGRCRLCQELTAREFRSRVEGVGTVCTGCMEQKLGIAH